LRDWEYSRPMRSYFAIRMVLFDEVAKGVNDVIHTASHRLAIHPPPANQHNLKPPLVVPVSELEFPIPYVHHQPHYTTPPCLSRLIPYPMLRYTFLGSSLHRSIHAYNLTSYHPNSNTSPPPRRIRRNSSSAPSSSADGTKPS